MNDIPRQKLRELITQYGEGLCNEPRRLEGLLRDTCGEYKREIFVLVSAAKEHVPSELLVVSGSTPLATLLARLTARLQDNLMLAETGARWAVESWVLALGKASQADLAALLTSQSASTGYQHNVVGVGNPQGAAAQSSAPASTAIDQLRAAIAVAKADGVVSPAARAALENLARNLGLPTDVTLRVFAENGVGLAQVALGGQQPNLPGGVQSGRTAPTNQPSASPPSRNIQAYCVHDRKMVSMQNPKQITLRNGRIATQGTCPECGTKVTRIGGGS